MKETRVTTHEELIQGLQQNPEFRKQLRLIKPLYLISLEMIKLRKKLNLTQKELAKLANTHQGRISKIESSEMDIRLSTLVGIAEALECQLEINFIPFSNTFFDTPEEPYQALFGTNTEIQPSSAYLISDPIDIQYQPAQITEGYYGQCN